MKPIALVVFSVLTGCALAAETPAATKKPAFTPEQTFVAACSNAWIKCVTEPSPVAAAVGEEIKFSLSLEGVTNAIPSGAFRYKWTRIGADNQTETGFAPLEKKPFVHTVKPATNGFLRLTAEIVDKSGKPLMRTQHKKLSAISFTGGAGAGVDALTDVVGLAPKEFAARVKTVKRKLSETPLKTVARTPVTIAGLQNAKAFQVSIPCPGGASLAGYLVVPSPAKGETTVKLPVRVEFVAVAAGQTQQPPVAANVPKNEILLVVGSDMGKPESRDEAFCETLFLRAARAVQAARTLPEWDGRDLIATGWGFNGVMAIWAGVCDEGVTRVCVGDLETCAGGFYQPSAVVRHLPTSCFFEIVRAGLGDVHVPLASATVWNAASCDKRIVWMQGAADGVVPKSYKRRDTICERILPVRYRNMDAEHYKMIGRVDHSFKDLEFALRDHLVIQVVCDYQVPEKLSGENLVQTLSYAQRDAIPVQAFVVLSDAKVKDKLWDNFLGKAFGEKKSVPPIPIYTKGAGMDLPAPAVFPWFFLADIDGVLRYSGPDYNAMFAAYQAALRAAPPADPVFAYARPELFKSEIEKMRKAKMVGPKIYKAIEMEMKKCARTEPARADEAAHLLLGMRQANERRLRLLTRAYEARAGKAYGELQVFLKEWPELGTSALAKALIARATKNPEIEKLAKMEVQLEKLLAWQPEKKMEIRKRDAEVAAFRKKLERMVNSKDPIVQGEALLIQQDLDNPPQPQP